MTIPILEVRACRYRKVIKIAWNQISSSWRKWDLNPGVLAPTIVFFNNICVEFHWMLQAIWRKLLFMSLSFYNWEF